MAPSYAGRTTQAASIRNFGGLNAKASPMLAAPGEAVSVSNWDMDLSGAITRRDGYVEQSTFGGVSTNHFDTFFKLDGSAVFVAVSGGNLFEADTPAGPWANRGGTFTTGDFTYIGSDLNGQYVLFNGVDKPHVFVPGQAVQTLETASLLTAPTGLTVVSTNGAGVTWQYAVTASTPRGETLTSIAGVTSDGPTSLTVTAFNALNWVPPAGAFSQTVYRYSSSANVFRKIAILFGTVSSYTDNGSAVEDVYSYPPTSNTALNTPEDWNTNGQPEGAVVVSRGRNQRMLAWRKNVTWACALSNIYDWYSQNDAFSFEILGGNSNNIKAVATLFDYTVMFSETNSFVYTGSSASDWSLAKILKTGCPSHYAITDIGDQVVLWSQNGPTTVERILSGQDIQTGSVSAKISPIVFGGTNLSEWRKIRAWHDIQRQRVAFAAPGVGQTKNTFVLLFNYQTKAWTRFDGWEVENIAYDPFGKENYALLSDNSIVKLHSGDTDAVAGIANEYATGHYDAGSDKKKRQIFLDVFMDGSDPYFVEVALRHDFATSDSETHSLSYDGATALTNGEPIVDATAGVNTHRLVVTGNVNTVQFVFRDKPTFTPQRPARIVGWTGDFRAYGIR